MAWGWSGNAMNFVLRPAFFVPFDERRAVRIYDRNLPHWRQDGCTYYVTFRLADSIPDSVRREWEQEKQKWLERHGIAYDGEKGCWRKAFHRLPPREQFRFEHHFNRRVQSCLDRGLGECHLREPECAAALKDELVRDVGRRHHMGDFVIMPNHVHALITPVGDEAVVERNSFRSTLGDDAERNELRSSTPERNEFRSTLSDQSERYEFRSTKLELILKSIKGTSAVACNRLRHRTGSLWQADSYDHIVRSLEQLCAYREYIARNPVLAHLELPPQAIYRADWMDAWLRAS